MGSVDQQRAAIESMYDAVRRGDLDGATSHLDPDVEWVMPSQQLRGREQVRAWLDEWLVSFEVEFRVDELRAVGEDVLALVNIRYSGRDPEIGEAQAWPAQLWGFRDGKASRCRIWPRRDDALRELGLTGAS
jgi:ketosteroid isomerase-like protein